VLRPIASRFAGIRSRRWLLIARLEWERGRSRRALRSWRRADATARQLGGDYDLARAGLEIVRQGLAGAERERLLADAIATFEQLGATRELRRAQSL
jgi:hypothetical protein